MSSSPSTSASAKKKTVQIGSGKKLPIIDFNSRRRSTRLQTKDEFKSEKPPRKANKASKIAKTASAVKVKKGMRKKDEEAETFESDE